jgi:hypothetical protein
LNVLKNECGVSEAFDLTQGAAGPSVKKFIAIWDTGATNCVISQSIVDTCSLSPTGITNVHGVHGASQVETFLVNIYLPNGLVIQTVRVTQGDLSGADILIGMDVINRGDFSVTNRGGATKFSFRFPSKKHIDFVEEDNKENARKASSSSQRKPKKRKQRKTYGKNKRRK